MSEWLVQIPVRWLIGSKNFQNKIDSMMCCAGRAFEVMLVSVCVRVHVELCFVDVSLVAAFPLPDPGLPRLTHLSKARPRNQKQHAAKRPIVGPESLLIENTGSRDDGLDMFFSSGTTDKQHTGAVKLKPTAKSRRSWLFCAFIIVCCCGKC